MPRNTTGGSGHRAQRNSEGSKARHNRELVDDLLDDIKNNEKLDGVNVARVLRRMGNGRMEVFYIRQVVDNDSEDALAMVGSARKIRNEAVQQIIPMRGGLRGKGKGTVWVDIDALVMIAETGLAGTTHEIVSVFSAEQVAKFRRLKPDADERLFLKSRSDGDAEGDGIVFDTAVEESGEVDIDDI